MEMQGPSLLEKIEIVLKLMIQWIMLLFYLAFFAGFVWLASFFL